LLVIYYNNSKGINARILTLISNRIGDGLLLIAIAIILNKFRISLFSLSLIKSKEILFLIFFIVLATTTKSAQIPFSA